MRQTEECKDVSVLRESILEISLSTWDRNESDYDIWQSHILTLISSLQWL